MKVQFRISFSYAFSIGAFHFFEFFDFLVVKV
ncbi:hypothetical protein P872_01865 [Rhodonellum psychrophilum GCM71 = DSM 17998]|uniref:Uncharacterized protein n=1 Tax=Rhodonellum psychrophilum GCM71 = DSM 17998 TaxID=1123057 RepID=U5BT72_9BACT|nr:hypothetical protein P872_01865 [Rhodonellum psychrophilum GCM71 = DSM 17998]